MKNLKVSAKLLVSFMIVVVLAIAVGVIGTVGMYSINSAGEALYNENVVALSAMGYIREILQDQFVQIRNLALHAGNYAKIQEYQNTLVTLDSEMIKQFAEYEKSISDPSQESAYFDAKNKYLTDFADIKRRELEASYISEEAIYDELFDPRVADVKDSLINGFGSTMTHNVQWASDTVKSNGELFRTMLIVEIGFLAVAVIAALMLALYISSIISKPLILLTAFMKKAGSTGDINLTPADVENIKAFSIAKDEIGQAINYSAVFVNHVTSISKSLELISDGDLSIDVDVLSPEDVMGQSLQKMIANLNMMFSEIQASTIQVATGSKQVADGAQALAQGSTEQAASIEELSSSISEIAGKTKDNFETAKKTSKLSESIKENAEKGSRQMGDMITAVKEINDASQSISKIIKTIDDIAFQTNILALNAAVEAARAGQHGKGFAVVAEEVRNLASKSADAAKDTGDMIQNAMGKAELGSQIAEETSQSLNDIVSGINESSNLIDEIADASEEQSVGISQINIGIDQVAQVIQQNSATAEQSAAASEEMSGQSDMLQMLITKFKLKNGGQQFRGLPGAGNASQRRIGSSRLQQPQPQLQSQPPLSPQAPMAQAPLVTPEITLPGDSAAAGYGKY